MGKIAKSMALCWACAAAIAQAQPGSDDLLEAPFRAGDGLGCWATPFDGRGALVPSHCVAERQAGGSMARDYAWIPSRRGGLRWADIGSASRAAGESVVWGGGRKATIVQASGGAYWLRASQGAFCPGDSGSALWALEDGRLKWIGMLVSGGEGAANGCSELGVAVKAQAIAWAGAL